ncbi:unnamed protein product [Gordionus sp. m RMFG-2023]|uniref:uncharacterized protein LOC135926650 n=1 Tax=Gordionus sp. m RMFG-2023 TaxID=3053472 RepID=UPI0030E0A5C8
MNNIFSFLIALVLTLECIKIVESHTMHTVLCRPYATLNVLCEKKNDFVLTTIENVKSVINENLIYDMDYYIENQNLWFGIMSGDNNLTLNIEQEGTPNATIRRITRNRNPFVTRKITIDGVNGTLIISIGNHQSSHVL